MKTLQIRSAMPCDHDYLSDTAFRVLLCLMANDGNTRTHGLIQFKLRDLRAWCNRRASETDEIADALDELVQRNIIYWDGDLAFIPELVRGTKFGNGTSGIKSREMVSSYRTTEKVLRKEIPNIERNVAFIAWQNEHENFIMQETAIQNAPDDIEKEGKNLTVKSDISQGNDDFHRENDISTVKTDTSPQENPKTDTSALKTDTSTVKSGISQGNDDFHHDFHTEQSSSVSSVSSISSGEGNFRNLKRGAGKNFSENPSGSDDLLSRCVEQGVERGFAERCIAERNAVQWHDATGGVISDPVRYVQAAFRKRNGTATPQNHTDTTTSMVSTKNGLKTPANGKTQNGMANGEIDRQKLFEMSLDEVIASAGSPARNGVAA